MAISWQCVSLIGATIRSLGYTRLVARLKPEPVPKVTKGTSDRGRFPVLEGILGVESPRVATEIRRRMSTRQAKRRLHFGRPNQILAFHAPSRRDPGQLPAVRAAHATGIVPGLTQQPFGGEVRAEVLHPVVPIAVRQLLVLPLRQNPHPCVVTLRYKRLGESQSLGFLCEHHCSSSFEFGIEFTLGRLSVRSALGATGREAELNVLRRGCGVPNRRCCH